MEAVSICAEKNETLAYYLPMSKKYERQPDGVNYWIGIKQYYQTKPVNGKINITY